MCELEVKLHSVSFSSEGWSCVDCFILSATVTLSDE